MGITSKKVGTTIGDAYVIVEWFGASDQLLVNINGATYQFPMYLPHSDTGGREETIRALKEAVAEL